MSVIITPNTGKNIITVLSDTGSVAVSIAGPNTIKANLDSPLINRHNDLIGLQGGQTSEFYHLNSGQYFNLTTGSVVRPSETGQFYPNSNPSGFITGVNLSIYATQSYVTGVSGSLQVQITNLNNATGSYVLDSETGSFITTSQTGAFYDSNNPSGFITGIDNLVFTTGDQTISGIKTFIDLFVDGADITEGGQSPNSQLRGGAFIGSKDGSIGTTIYKDVGTPTAVAIVGTNSDITQYNDILISASSNPTLYVGTTNTVGINTTSPDEQLSVSGNLKVAGNIILSDVGEFKNFASFNNPAGLSSFIGGGQNNLANEEDTFIGGGSYNSVNGFAGNVVGGRLNTANGYYSFVGAGENNTAHTNYSFIGGGEYNETSGNFSSVIFGRKAKIDASHDGASIISDGRDQERTSKGSNTLFLDFENGVHMSSRPIVNGTGVLLSGDIDTSSYVTGDVVRPDSSGEFLVVPSGYVVLLCLP